MKKIRVGTSENVISPPKGAPDLVGNRIWKGVHDDLMAKALVLDNGEEKIAFVALDMGGFSAEYVEATRNQIERETGIERESVLIGCTHTHSAFFLGWPPYGPQGDVKVGSEVSEQQKALLEGWISTLPCLISTTVKNADNNLREAELSFCQTSVTGISYNRRKTLPYGAVTFTGLTSQMKNFIKQKYVSWGMSEEEVNKLAFYLVPNGPIDPRLSILKVDSSGKIAALAINFSCHPVTANGYMNLVSADYPGYLTRITEGLLGCRVLFFQGNAGDLRPFFSRTSFEEAERIGVTLASRVLEAIKNPCPINGAQLRVLSKKIQLPTKSFPLTPYHTEKILKNLRHRLERAKDEADYASVRRLATAEKGIAEVRRLMGRERTNKGQMEVEIQVIRVGDAVFVAIPGEPLAELGLEIKSKAWTQKIFVIGLANGEIGYIPNREHYALGGYEPAWSCVLLPGGGEKIVKTAVALVEKIQKA